MHMLRNFRVFFRPWHRLRYASIASRGKNCGLRRIACIGCVPIGQLVLQAPRWLVHTCSARIGRYKRLHFGCGLCWLCRRRRVIVIVSLPSVVRWYTSLVADAQSWTAGAPSVPPPTVDGLAPIAARWPPGGAGSPPLVVVVVCLFSGHLTLQSPGQSS